jgi:hypothetical protein
VNHDDRNERDVKDFSNKIGVKCLTNYQFYYKEILSNM